MTYPNRYDFITLNYGSHKLVVIVKSDFIQMSLVVLIPDYLHGAAFLGHKEACVTVINIHPLNLHL